MIYTLEGNDSSHTGNVERFCLGWDGCDTLLQVNKMGLMPPHRRGICYAQPSLLDVSFLPCTGEPNPTPGFWKCGAYLRKFGSQELKFLNFNPAYLCFPAVTSLTERIVANKFANLSLLLHNSHRFSFLGTP